MDGRGERHILWTVPELMPGEHQFDALADRQGCAGPSKEADHAALHVSLDFPGAVARIADRLPLLRLVRIKVGQVNPDNLTACVLNVGKDRRRGRELDGASAPSLEPSP